MREGEGEGEGEGAGEGSGLGARGRRNDAQRITAQHSTSPTRHGTTQHNTTAGLTVDDSVDVEHRLPVLTKDIEAHVAFNVDVRMVYLCVEKRQKI